MLGLMGNRGLEIFVRYVSHRICSSLTPRIQTLLKPTAGLLLMIRCTSLDRSQISENFDLEDHLIDSGSGSRIRPATAGPILLLFRKENSQRDCFHSSC